MNIPFRVRRFKKTDQIFHHKVGSKIPRLMSAHAIRHNKQILQGSNGFCAGVDRVLIHAPLLTYICQCICLHASDPSFAFLFQKALSQLAAGAIDIASHFPADRHVDAVLLQIRLERFDRLPV